MFSVGLILVVLGILAEWPLSSEIRGSVPPDVTSACLFIIGLILVFWGLYEMAAAKWRNWAIAFLALFGLVGASLGLIIILILPNRNPDQTPMWLDEKCPECGRHLHRSGRCTECDGVV